MMELSSMADLESCLAETSRPVVFFKHSTQCPISTHALSEFRAFVDEQPDVAQFVYLDLIAHRDLSRSIAERLDVPHESPQLIWLEHGGVKAVLNHDEICRAELQGLLNPGS